MAPSDEYGYRLALIEAFRLRGIFPDRVSTMSLESLRWSSPTDFTKAKTEIMGSIRALVRNNIRQLLDEKDRKKLYEASQKTGAKFHTLLMTFTQELKTRDTNQVDSFLEKLGLSSTNGSTRPKRWRSPE